MRHRAATGPGRFSVIAVGSLLLIAGLASFAGSHTMPIQRMPSHTGVPAAVSEQAYTQSSAGWYWVYKGVSQTQTFVAEGNVVTRIRLRVSQLNDEGIGGTLVVEVSCPNTGKVLGRGRIVPDKVTTAFNWVEANMEFQVPLKRGELYNLCLRSIDTAHDAPWLVNAIYRDLYPRGEHVGYKDDLFFTLEFDRARMLKVGPPRHDYSINPINCGRRSNAAPMSSEPISSPLAK